LFITLCIGSAVARLAERPSPELLRYMAAIGATFLIAYAIEFSAVVRDAYRRSAKRESWIGSAVGFGAAGLFAIVASLALAERAEVQHWGWLDSGVFAFSIVALCLLGMLLVALPALAYDWWRGDGDPDRGQQAG
jgi:hypothetical protein